MDETAVSVCVGWFKFHEVELASRNIRVEYRGEKNDNAAVWLHCPGHIVDVCVWNHAKCLDILVLEKSSGEMVYSVAGPCEENHELLQRIEAFWSWYVSLPKTA